MYKSILANEFRVVHLLPGQFNDDIQCVLETRSWKIKTRYEALSYQWGDGTATRPIRISHLGGSSKPPVTPDVASTSLTRTSKACQALATRHATPLRFLSWCLGTCLCWCWVAPLPLDAPPWASRLLPRDIYIFLICAVCGQAPLDLLVWFCMLILEIMRTKPWRLAFEFNGFGKGGLIQRPLGQFLDYQTLEITENLALALQYLRHEKKSRTLWVDALSINQKNENEKELQVQHMDRLYANASVIVIWLGAYHGITESSVCDDKDDDDNSTFPRLEGDGCRHVRQIQAAFQLIRFQSGWRLMTPHRLRRCKKETLSHEGLSGLRELSRRGWWKRLWVIQEVALATGHVQIQCGHDKCGFGDYHSAHARLLIDHPEDKELQDDFSSSDCMLKVVQAFRYSHYYPQKESARWLLDATTSILGLMFPGSKDHMIDKFQGQPFAQRLQQVLLRTSGHFQCHHDKDRLYAVLGISGGSQEGKGKRVSSLIEYISSQTTHTIVLRVMTPFLEATTSTATQVIIGLASASWSIFYEDWAKFWAISRPEYVVAAYKEVINAITHDSDGHRRNKPGFFAALAKYISQENESLAFLDAANCGEDEDDMMPSWVPSWTKGVSKDAFKFATRIKKADEAPAAFHFLEDGKTLVLLGQPRGTVHVVRSINTELPSSESADKLAALDCWFALSKELRHAIKELSANAIDTVTNESTGQSAEARWEVMLMVRDIISSCFKAGSSLLKSEGGTLVYSRDPQAGQETGFLKAGTARRGDKLVYVPDCFHHLVLRLISRKSTGVRWKLVGLVKRNTQSQHDRVYTKTELLTQLQDSAIYSYAVQ